MSIADPGFHTQPWKGLGAGAVFRHYAGYPINEPRILPNGTYGRPGVNVFDPDGELVPPEARGATFQRVLQFQTRPEFDSDYNALELSLEKRYSQRWSGRISYTYSKANDVGAATGGANISTKRVSDDLNPRSDYGRTNFDNRPAFAFSFHTQPWKGLGAGAVFRHYSGYPINEPRILPNGTYGRPGGTCSIPTASDSPCY